MHIFAQKICNFYFICTLCVHMYLLSSYFGSEGKPHCCVSTTHVDDRMFDPWDFGAFPEIPRLYKWKNHGVHLTMFWSQWQRGRTYRGLYVSTCINAVIRMLIWLINLIILFSLSDRLTFAMEHQHFKKLDSICRSCAEVIRPSEKRRKLIDVPHLGDLVSEFTPRLLCSKCEGQFNI